MELQLYSVPLRAPRILTVKDSVIVWTLIMHNTSIQLLLYVSFILTGERYIPQDAVDDVVEAELTLYYIYAKDTTLR